MTELDGPRMEAAGGGQATALVVLLHGLGADGNDLIGLAPVWAPHLPHVAFSSPHAPFPCDMAPFGRQWFSLQVRTEEVILKGVREAAPILETFLAQELERHGLGWDRLALVGFSQGTMMSLHVAPRLKEQVAGVVGYSGALVGDDLLDGELASKPPVSLVHGEADEVVPFGAMPAAEAALAGAGIEVESLARPGLGHGIDEEGLRRGLAFLQRVLPQ
ncbi:alpha/beta hydrolase [Nisaea acidiphila]|uniref:Alpha/beta hydrolase n=1 Tax=Nisaea acidiphila TaxID=1862145 RepID=A0A9J7B017_9PROT|nr:alpha/beta hydrolase [Nisaea acidiphila]UUX51037.1 alpha/beta hydrolase [Nisaea acidiphila]